MKTELKHIGKILLVSLVAIAGYNIVRAKFPQTKLP